MPPLDKELTGDGVGFHSMPIVPDNAGIMYKVRRFVVGVDVAGEWTAVVQVEDIVVGLLALLRLRYHVTKRRGSLASGNMMAAAGQASILQASADDLS